MTAPKDIIRRRVVESIQVKEQLLAEDPIMLIARVAEEIVRAYRRGNKVVLFGNGGSASDAQHMAAELVGRYLYEREGLPALAMTANPAVVTAIANDYAFDRVFVRQVEALGSPGDVAIGISTSGNSANVVAGLEAAKEKGLVAVALTGRDGGYVSDVVDYCVRIPSEVTPRIQEAHILIVHLWCELVERAILGRHLDD